MAREFRFCPECADPLEFIAQLEDGGEKERLRCVGCGYTHWNNPTPVLAAIIEHQGHVLLARNAAWIANAYALITGFMEAGETPEDGVRREIEEETSLRADALALVGVYDFQRMNQVIIAYHAVCHGEVKLSPELADYKLLRHEDVVCWPQGTGRALADWLRSRGIEPKIVEFRR